MANGEEKLLIMMCVFSIAVMLGGKQEQVFVDTNKAPGSEEIRNIKVPKEIRYLNLIINK